MKEFRVVLKFKDKQDVESLWVDSEDDLIKAIEAGMELYNADSFIVQSRMTSGEDMGVIKNEH